MNYRKYDGGKVKLNQEISDWLKNKRKRPNSVVKTNWLFEFLKRMAVENKLTEDELYLLVCEVKDLLIENEF